jgi:hypothetical protein
MLVPFSSERGINSIFLAEKTNDSRTLV